MFNILKKKEILIALLFVMLLSAYGIYIRTEIYQFNSAKSSGDYWMLWRFINENRTSEQAREAHSMALDQLLVATPSMRVFYLLYDRGRAAADEDYEKLAYLNREDGKTYISYVSGSLKPTWQNWEEFELYLIVKHYLKFRELDNTNKNAQMIKGRIASIVNNLDLKESLFLDQLEFVIDMSNVSGIEPPGNSVKLLDRKIFAFLENIVERPLDKSSDRLWQRINWAIRDYTFKRNLKSQLSGKVLERMRYIHSNTSIKSNEKIKYLIKENEDLLKIDSMYNWTPLYYGLIEYEDRIDSLADVKDEYEVVEARLSEAQAALSKVSKVSVNILRKLEGNNYDAVVGGQLKIILSMLDRVFDRTGYYELTIMEFPNISGYKDSYTNMPIPLYYQYTGDYNELKEKYNLQLESKKNINERIKLAEANLKEIEPILLDLFGKLANR